MSDKYSVLLMRDDQHVRRFRISRHWLPFGGLALLTVCVLAVGGLYMGYSFLIKNEELKQEKLALESEVHDQQVRLSRLQEYEKYLENNDPAQLQAMAAATNASNGSEETTANDPLDLNDLLASVDLGRAEVQDFSLVRREQGDGLDMTFDLHNSDTGSPLAGSIEVTLLGGDGNPVDLELQGDDLSFQIENYKTMQATILLPDSINVEELFGLRLSIVAQDSDEVLYSRVYYPLNQLFNS